MFHAASLRHCISAWQDIKAAPHVSDWINYGVSIPFKSIPYRFYFENHNLNNKEQLFISNEVADLLCFGVISKVDAPPLGISPIGCVPKRGGKFRLILDLRHLSNYCVPPVFRYEDIGIVCDFVEYNDDLISADIKNGFYHIPVREQDRTYLGFQWNGNYYHFNVLPFGANFSPYFFCKTIREVVRYLWEQNLKLSCFVDDFLLASHYDTSAHDIKLFLDTLSTLGWTINMEKSHLIPAKQQEFIGYMIMTTPPEGVPVIKIVSRRIYKVKKDIKRVLLSNKNTVTAKILARIAGQCVSMTKVIGPAMLLLRSVYRLLKQRKDWHTVLVMNKSVRKDLEYWHNTLDSWNGRLTISRSVEVQALSDASQTGWGFACLNQEAAGLWDQWLAHHPSNTREMTAVLMGLLTFKDVLCDRSVQVMSDNISTVANIRLQGGPTPELTQIARAIWCVALNNNITLTARFIRGMDNQQADRLSRLADMYDWKLNPCLFQFIDNMWVHILWIDSPTC